MPAGRPTKYTPELLERAHAYLTDYEHHGAVFPSHIGLSLYLDISTKTLYEWKNSEDKQEFSSILDQITAIQHEMLVGNGITGTYNSNITKLVLGKHGYHDKQDLTGKDGDPLIPDSNINNLEMARRIAYELQKANKELDDATNDEG